MPNGNKNFMPAYKKERKSTFDHTKEKKVMCDRAFSLFYINAGMFSLLKRERRMKTNLFQETADAGFHSLSFFSKRKRWTGHW